MIFTAVNRVNFLSNNKWLTRATIGLYFPLIVCRLHSSISLCAEQMSVSRLRTDV